MRAKLLLVVLLVPVAWAAGCASRTTAPGAAPPAPADAPLPTSIQWMQQSAEYAAVALQTYRAATAWVEVEVRSRPPGTWAVILDADDTVINNIGYQISLARTGREHHPDLFTAWVRQRASTPVPGAARFLVRVRGLGGRIAIVTNRLARECDDTAEMLRMLALPFDDVLCRPDGAPSDKTPRFEAVAAGRSAASPTPVDVVAYLGDNILDFPDGSQDLRGRDDAAFAKFGGPYFALPNPMYGSWQ